MFLNRLLGASRLAVMEKYTAELLETNQKTKKYGLILTPEEIKNMLVFRNQVLLDYGRVELGIEVSKQLAEVFCTSPYINQQNYASTLNELHEIFYDLKNETEDKIDDFQLIKIMKNYFDHACGGSLELLKGKLEAFAQAFRSETHVKDPLHERDEL